MPDARLGPCELQAGNARLEWREYYSNRLTLNAIFYENVTWKYSYIEKKSHVHVGLGDRARDLD